MHALSSRHSRRGGALILALIFMGVVTAGFATWVMIIQQRGRSGDLDEHQARKRLSAANSEVMVRDYLMRRVLASNGDSDGLSATSGGSSYNTATATSWDSHSQISSNNGTNGSGIGWKGTLPETGYSLDTRTRLAGINGFSPTFVAPYSTFLDFTTDYRILNFVNQVASFPNDKTTWRGFVRSRSPLLGGDLLILHRPSFPGAAFPTVTGPTITTPGNVVVRGRVCHFAPDLDVLPGTPLASYTARSLRFISPNGTGSGGPVPTAVNIVPWAINVSPSDTTFSALPMSNLAWTPLSVGNVSSSNLEDPVTASDWRMPEFTGQLNFLDPPAVDPPITTPPSPKPNPSNSFRTRLTTTGTPILATGGVAAFDSRGFEIVLTGRNSTLSSVAKISPCLGVPVTDLPSIIIKDDLNEMIIEGQTGTNFSGYAPYRPAFGVLYTQNATGRNLTKITLRNQNNRRMILALKKDYRATWPSPATSPAINIVLESADSIADWHLIIICENVPITFTYPNTNTVRLYGGIQTNAPLIFPASPKLFEINLETDPRGLVRMTPRLAWVETYLTGKL